MSCYSRHQDRRAPTPTQETIKDHSTVSTRKLSSFSCNINCVTLSISFFSRSFVSPQTSNNNSIKRERDSGEIYGEESYDYSDEEEYEPAKRMKEA